MRAVLRRPGWIRTEPPGSALKTHVKDEAAVEQHFPEILPSRASPGRVAGAGQAVMTGLGRRLQAPKGRALERRAFQEPHLRG